MAATDLAIAAWGALAVAAPRQLVPGFEHFTGRSWPQLRETDPGTGAFLLLAFRLVGALNIAAALPLAAIALTGYRDRQRWAWWTLRLGHTTLLGAPITYDRTTGAIGVFERLE
ncbi:hypothetical protein ACI797_10105 [Geodermatophilus sp. SYSU D00691]